MMSLPPIAAAIDVASARGVGTSAIDHLAKARQPFGEQLHEAARQLVATALVTPVLQQMDASSLRPDSGPFAPTTVEKRFAPLLHQHLADRITLSHSFGLVDAISGRFSREPGAIS